MIQHTVYIGLFDKDTKVQKFTILEAFKTVDALCANMFDGATISEAHGVYKHEDNTVVVEPSLRVEIIAETLGDFVQVVKRIFNQESILVTRTVLNVSFE